MFKAVSRFVVKTGAVGLVLVTLVAISAIFATASVADAATGTVSATPTVTGYTLNFTVGPDATIASVSLTSGPGVVSQLALTEDQVDTFTGSLDITSTPAVGDAYQLYVSYVDDTTPAETITVSVTSVPGINFRGRVTDLAGNGISGVAVLVFTSTGVSVDANANNTVTQADGSYIYGGLNSGSYKVSFSKGSSTVWYNNKLGTFSDGDLLALTSGVTTNNVDAVMDSWGAIAGKATTSTGTPISGLKAELYTTGNVLVTSIPSVTTKTDGTYLFSLIPPGSYKVKLTGVAQGYTEQWANSGSAITVTSGNTTDVYPTAMPSINFSGTVTDINNTPVAGIWVYLYTNKNDANSLYYSFAGTRTQADGTYAVGGVPSGTYYVLFSTSGSGYEKQYYNRKASLSLADAVVIGSTAQGNINAVLGTGTPVITAFSVPATSASFTVSGITLTANDGNGVAGYMITESATAPEASATGWSSTAPTSYKFTTIGTKTLYAWAKGSTGLVSAGSQASVTISSAAMRTGDCDGSGSVSIAEVQSAINMYLGMKTVEQCVDQDNSGTASIAEVQKAINSFLGL